MQGETELRETDQKAEMVGRERWGEGWEGELEERDGGRERGEENEH